MSVLQIDYQLLSDVQKYATGQSVHQLANPQTKYLCAPAVYRETGAERWREIFQEAERELRAFVAKAKQREVA